MNEDCVHTLGVKHDFMWNDVGCDSCHNYTCSEGMSTPWYSIFQKRTTRLAQSTHISDTINKLAK